jgi:tripartite-type tricarboxylate transporter receptor subunit TctC
LSPDVPTLVELGYKDVVVGSWAAFFAPKGTPGSITKMLNEQLNEILKEPDVIDQLAVFGALPSGGAPQRLTQINTQDYDIMSKVIRDLGIRVE